MATVSSGALVMVDVGFLVVVVVVVDVVEVVVIVFDVVGEFVVVVVVVLIVDGESVVGVAVVLMTVGFAVGGAFEEGVCCVDSSEPIRWSRLVGGTVTICSVGLGLGRAAVVG